MPDRPRPPPGQHPGREPPWDAALPSPLPPRPLDLASLAVKVGQHEVRIAALENFVNDQREEASTSGKHELSKIERKAEELQREIDRRGEAERLRVEAENKARLAAEQTKRDQDAAEAKTLAKEREHRRNEWIKGVSLALVGGAIALGANAAKDCAYVARPVQVPAVDAGK